MVISLGKWLILPVMLFLNGNSGAMLHPFYVSVTEISQNKQEKILEISCKMFTDDVENALNRRYRTSIDILNPADTALARKLLGDYINSHLRLTVNGQVMPAEFIGYEKEGGALWSFLQVNNAAPVSRLAVKNDLLYEMFSTQIGIIHVTVDGKRKSTRLNAPDKEAVFNF